MTLTPDRTPGKDGKRSQRAAPGADAASEGAELESTSFLEQLKAAGMDLTGNPLADRFADIEAVPMVPVDDVAPVGGSEVGGGSNEDLAGGVNEGAAGDVVDAAGDVVGADSGDSSAEVGEVEVYGAGATDSPFGGPVESVQSNSNDARAASDPGTANDVGAAIDAGAEVDAGSEVEDADASDDSVPHPLLTDAEWNDLDHLAPELTQSIGSLSHLKDELLTFERPMGPDSAMTVVNGIETATRILEAMSAVALSVYERCGTPTDYGAKTTKGLVQNRLNLTGREAQRRTELAKNLGNRVDMAGQSRGPANPIVANGLHTGVLSAGQATVINDCLSKLPIWISAEVRTKVESDLVEKAPRVRVSDLRSIFNAILARIDPDGEEPKLPPDRDQYRVNVRARDNGDWVLSGLLDAVTGGILYGLLTSRILPTCNRGNGTDSTLSTGVRGEPGEALSAGSGSAPAFGDSAFGDSTIPDGADSAQLEFDIFGAVLGGDVFDAPLPAGNPDEDLKRVAGGDSEASENEASAGEGAQFGLGFREDGTPVNTKGDQGTVRNRIYERFATLVSRIEMNRVGRGSPFALVVTAKAEDLVTGTGRAVTGSEAEFPLATAVNEGLNGSVFFNLTSDKAKSMQLATENRYATSKQLAIITARDKGCTFPGCDAPPGWCDVHHIVPWSEDGKTDVNNLTLACGKHHHLIDKSDWYARSLKDGRTAWIPPASIDIERRPILHARFIAQEILDDLDSDDGFSGQ